eukprot:gene29693-25831_t
MMMSMYEFVKYTKYWCSALAMMMGWLILPLEISLCAGAGAWWRGSGLDFFRKHESADG